MARFKIKSASGKTLFVEAPSRVEAQSAVDGLVPEDAEPPKRDSRTVGQQAVDAASWLVIVMVIGVLAAMFARAIFG